ncbi:cyclin-D3-1-like [Juglans microcarpa x Juglans regia]|uniref:cyclin-D3-1-like n=1 Tax=Juglans microcarpa x Juglans regia TaxID=2249226 RepID=UPI001B7DD092|nr:cyclin-D3-1-like [Juglans microcarpa x Juglans regia]
MAIQLQNEQQIEQHEQGSSLLLDALYCEEERWVEEGEVLQGESESETYGSQNNDVNKPSLFPLHLPEQDLFWEDEELLSLFSKEQKQAHLDYSIVETDSGTISVARREAVEWMLKVHVYYGFSIPTAILAINYLDRFLTSLHIQRDKPCMIQLVAVACLSLAAKVEETQVPLLLDLQVEGAKYVFEAKIIQRMELLVLATLQWKMQPVTPLSFIDHVIRRVGLKTHLQVDFLRRCERLLLSVVSGSRFVGYLPSVLATATMMHVIYQVEPCNHIEYENQLLGVLEISKEKVNDCYNLIAELPKADNCDHYNLHKRKYEQIPCSPNGVIDAGFSSDGSNDSWAVGSSVYSSPEPLFKKRRANEQQLKFSPFSRVSVGIVGSSP